MSIDASHIIRHSFQDVRNKEASKEFVFNTIEHLNKQLFLNCPIELFHFCYDEDDNECFFRLPFYDVEFNLHRGCWRIDSYIDYCCLPVHYNRQFGLRNMIFDIARALGNAEAWHACEYYTWNGNGLETVDCSFDHWLDFAKQKVVKEEKGKHNLQGIPEFDPNVILSSTSNWELYDNYINVYHDSFKDCEEQFNELQKRLDDFQLLGLYDVGNGFVRCTKDNNLYLVNESTLQPLFNHPIDRIQNDLNGPEFVVVMNGLSAVYDGDGNQLTEYSKGAFEWKWDVENYPHRIIYNDMTKLTLHV